MQAALENSIRTSLSPLSQNKQVWPRNDTVIVQKPTHENTKYNTDSQKKQYNNQNEELTFLFLRNNNLWYTCHW